MSVLSEKVEFGDFQTPLELASDICAFLARRRVLPASIVEPTCGVGSFLLESAKRFPNAKTVLGFDVNSAYVATTKASAAEQDLVCCVETRDFFQTDWQGLLDSLPEPILVIGNPPWVTNAALGIGNSKNLPAKSNFQGRKGFDAITGKSNFDISEWMLLHLLDWLSGRKATLAMLCKTAVARKVLQHGWKNGSEIRRSELHRIDADKHFGVSVDACLLACFMQPGKRSQDCQTYEALNDASQRSTFGYHDGKLIGDVETYGRLHDLAGGPIYRWRSGVKHDCAKVMELRESPKGLINGLGETVDIEPDYLYPLAKSSDVAKGMKLSPTRWLIVPQREVGEDTASIESAAPKTWAYLLSHSKALDKRGSSIYRKRPRFSVFGIGGYTFAPWKVAISGFYKSLSFSVARPHRGKPVVFDDTVYTIACKSRAEAEFMQALLASNEAQQFYSSLVFWDAKRPVTADLLNSLRLEKVAERQGLSSEFAEFREANPWTVQTETKEPTLFNHT